MSNDISTIKQAVKAIKTAILQGQYEAAKDVNRVQLMVYYGVGRYLSQHTRKGVWGTGAIKSISEQLRRELPGLRGFSETSMKKMRLFYEAWSSLDTNSSVATDELASQDKSSVTTDEIAEGVNLMFPVTVPNAREFPIEDFFTVPFTHHVEIFSGCKQIQERYYYLHRVAEEHLSVDALKRSIRDDDYSNQANIPNNFSNTLPTANFARKAVEMFKDSYLLDFINVEEIGERDEEDIDERVVEQQIIQNIKKFIMTFGKDFTFVGNQYHLEIYSEEMFPDLLFFNRELNALVCVELKTGKFKPGYLGQLSAYLKVLDDKVKKTHENPSIGIILCKTANKNFVEYVIQGYDKPMGVATYTTSADMPEKLREALPDTEELRKLLNDKE